MVIFTPRTVYPLEKYQKIIGQKAEFSADPVWTWRRREKSLPGIKLRSMIQGFPLPICWFSAWISVPSLHLYLTFSARLTLSPWNRRKQSLPKQWYLSAKVYGGILATCSCLYSGSGTESPASRCGFPKSLQANIGIEPLITPRPLPCT
jgi:hypothetical protein